jgi:hypothetical protein
MLSRRSKTANWMRSPRTTTLALIFIGAGGGKLKAAGEVFDGRDIAIAECKNRQFFLEEINYDL